MRRWFGDPPHSLDVVAGISVALVLIPQSLAYAELAGLPPHIGLFAAALPPIAASVVASSPYLQTGPVALTSLLTFGALSNRADTGTAEYVRLAILLALIVGVVRVAIGVLRLGVLAYLMSEPVLIGFTSGAAIVILSSQLPTALGSLAPGDGVLEDAWWALLHPDGWDGETIAVALVSGAIIFGGRRLHHLFPGVLVAVVVALIWSLAADYGGSIVGDVPAGLPDFGLDVPWGETGALLIPGVIIALVGFAEAGSISRTFAAADRKPWDSNREFIGQGLANVASGISGGFPVGGSSSRSSINRLAGARTRWSGAVTGLAVLAFLPAASILEDLPRAALAVIVITAVVGLVRPVRLAQLWRASRRQAVVAWVTFTAVLVLSPRVEWAVIAGVALAVGVHLYRELSVDVAVEIMGPMLRLRLRGVFWFGSAPRLEQLLIDLLASTPEAAELVLDLHGVGRLDYTGAVALQRVVEDAKAAGLEVRLTNVPNHSAHIIWRVVGG